jgi:hypothetical protein
VRLLALAVLVTNAAFVPGAPVPALRSPRALEPAQVPGWTALRDRETGVIARMWGGTFAAFGASADARVAERAARDFIAIHGLAAGELVMVANRVDRGLRTVAFEQRVAGVRVLGGQVHVVFAHDRVVLAGSEALPFLDDTHRAGANNAVRLGDLSVANLARRPTVSSARVAPWLARELADDVRALTVDAARERVIVPISRATGIEYRVADIIGARRGIERWDVYVGLDGEPFGKRARTSSATSTLRFDVPERHPASTRILAPAPNVGIVVDGTATTTDALGGFAWPGVAAATVDVTPIGPGVEIIDEADGTIVSAQLVAQPGVPIDFARADAFGDAQLASFIHASTAKVHARRMHPTLAWLDTTLGVHVNFNDSCNAQSTGDDIFLFRGNSLCENTGRIADVVMHEVAHSFHTQSIIPGAGAYEDSLAEGIADFFAANITGDPAVGRGFHFDEQPVRDLAPFRVYPKDLTGVPHTNGLIVGGALWDLRTALVEELGAERTQVVIDRVYVGIIQRASDMPTAFTAALLGDDDNGNLGDGTPNFCAIELAFGRRGFVPDFQITRIAPPVVTGREVTVAVQSPTTACPRARVSSMMLELHADGVMSLPMTATGDTWSATLPEQPAGTVVRYRVLISLDDGSSQAFPDNAGDPLYQLFFGDATPIWCEPFDVDPKWTNNGGWEFGPPFGRSGDAPLPFTGVNLIGTDIFGDGRYNAGTNITITTPPIDTTAFTRTHLQFRRWLTTERADRATVLANGEPVWTSVDDADHVDREWRFVDVELAPRADLTLSWALTADDVTELGGWNIDDVCVVGLGKIPACGDGFVDVDEECDGGPDCTPDCALEPPDDTGCCSSSGGPTSLLLALGILAKLHRRRRIS